MKRNKGTIYLLLNVLLAHFSMGAMEITEKTITDHQRSFQTFIGDLETKLSYIPRSPWVPECVVNLALKNVSKFLGNGTITLEDVKFLDRFFQDKKQTGQAIAILANNQENVDYVDYISAIISEFEKTDKTFEDLYSSIDAKSREKLGTKKEAQEKNKNGNFVIDDTIYFNYTACNLFVAYLWDQKLITNTD